MHARLMSIVKTSLNIFFRFYRTFARMYIRILPQIRTSGWNHIDIYSSYQLHLLNIYSNYCSHTRAVHKKWPRTTVVKIEEKQLPWHFVWVNAKLLKDKIWIRFDLIPCAGAPIFYEAKTKVGLFGIRGKVTCLTRNDKITGTSLQPWKSTNDAWSFNLCLLDIWKNSVNNASPVESHQSFY